MEQSTNDFQYHPLHITPVEFRIVQILPGPFDSPIRCILKHAYLGDNPSFEALSYVWGNPKDTVPITLDGHTFNVTNGLGSALRHLREERSQQVRFMGKLYIAAERTTIWLGPEDDDTALAFEYMREREEVTRAILLREILSQKGVRTMRLAIKILQGANFPKSANQNIRQSLRLQYLTTRLLLSDLREKSLSEKLFRTNIRLASIRRELDCGESTFVRASSILSHENRQLELAEEAICKDLFGQIWLAIGPHAESIRPEDQDSNSTSNLEKWDLQTIRQSLERRTIYSHMAAYSPAKLSPSTLEKIDNALSGIVEREWWRRVWVVQEIAMSRKVVFQSGTALASWSAIHSTIEHAPTDFIQGDFPYVLNLLRIWKINKSKGSELLVYQADLLDLLQQFRHCEATDPRDKVYALLDLATDVNEGDISIDYTLTPQEVYKNVVAFFLSRHKSLDILGAILGESFLPELPTWVPDWSFPADDDYEKPFFQRLIEGESVTRFYSASGLTTVPEDTRCCGNKLVLRGFVFDTVSDLCHPKTPILLYHSLARERKLARLSQSIIEVYEKKAFQAQEGLDPYGDKSGGRAGAFWHTIIADAIGEQRATEDAAELFDIWLGRSEAQTDAAASPRAFEGAVHRACHGRNFGTSSRNYMLLVPNSTLEGDLVCVLLGGQTPFILRPSGDKFYLIGACYAHGIMSGEAMDELQSGKYKLDDFVIE